MHASFCNAHNLLTKVQLKQLLAIWTYMIFEMQKKSSIIGWFLIEAIFGFRAFGARKINKIVSAACAVLPLRAVDQSLVGQPVGYMQDGLSNPGTHVCLSACLCVYVSVCLCAYCIFYTHSWSKTRHQNKTHTLCARVFIHIT